MPLRGSGSGRTVVRRAASAQPEQENRRDTPGEHILGNIGDAFGLAVRALPGAFKLAGAVGGDVLDAAFQVLPGERGSPGFESRTLEEVVKPLGTSFANTVGQGGGMLNPINTIVGGSLKVLGGEGIAENIAEVMSLAPYLDVAGHKGAADSIRAETHRRWIEEDSLLLPLIEDLGNLALGAGAAIKGASIAGRVTGSARLSNVAATGQVVQGGARLAEVEGLMASKGLTYSPAGARLGAISRPFRSAARGAGAVLPDKVQQVRSNAISQIQTRLSDADFTTSISGKSKSWMADRVLDALDPDQRALRSTYREARNQFERAVRAAKPFMDVETNLTDLKARLGRLAGLDESEAAAMVRTLGFDPRKIAGHKLTDEQFLATLDYVDEQGIQLTKNKSLTEQALNDDTRRLENWRVKQARLNLAEKLNGVDNGAASRAIRAVLEMDDLAFVLSASRKHLLQMVDEGVMDAATLEQLFSLADEGGAEFVRLLEQELPDAALQGDSPLAGYFNEAVEATREFSGLIEANRRRVGDLSDTVGSRIDPETGKILPGDEATVFEGVTESAKHNKAMARAMQQADDASSRLGKLDELLAREGGLAQHAARTQAPSARHSIYQQALDQASLAVRAAKAGDAEGVRAALEMLEQTFEEGARFDTSIDVKTPANVLKQQERLLKHVSELESLAEGRTLAKDSRKLAQAAEEGLARRGSSFAEEFPEELWERALASNKNVSTPRSVDLDSYEDFFLLNKYDENGNLAASVTFGEASSGVGIKVVVNPALRGQGLARELVQEALKEAQRRGWSIEEILQKEYFSESGRGLASALSQSDLSVGKADQAIAAKARKVNSAQEALRRVRDDHTKRVLGQAAAKSSEKLKARVRYDDAVTKTIEEVQTKLLDYIESTDAVPRAGRPLVTYANTAFPKIAEKLRETGGAAEAKLADALDNAPKDLQGLLDYDITAPDGTTRKLGLTYVPDLLDDLERESRGLGALSQRAMGEVTEPRPGHTRRQHVKDIRLETDPYTLAHQQIRSTIHTEFQRQFVDTFTQGWTKSTVQITDELGLAEDATSDQIARAAAKNGYVLYNPKNVFAAFSRAKFAPAEGRWVKREFAQVIERLHGNDPSQFVQMIDNIADASYDHLMAGWRSSVLSLRPQWHLNNIIGGFILSTFLGKVSVGDYMANLATSFDVARRAGDDVLGNEIRVLRSTPGATFRAARGRVKDADIKDRITLTDKDALLVNDAVDRSLLRGELIGGQPSSYTGAGAARLRDSASRNKGTEILKRSTARTIESTQRTAARSAAFNSLFDDMNRVQVMLGHAMVDGAFDATAGVRAANRVFGDYFSMTPFERKWMRRVFPFYSWTRNITTALGKHLMDLNEVDRTILFTNVMMVIGEPDEYESMLPGYAAMDIHTGFNEAGFPTFFSPRGADPFSDALIFSGREGPVDAVVRGLSPVITGGIEKVFGYDTLTGRSMTGIGDEPRPSVAQLVSEAVPQVRLVRDFLRERSGQTLARLGDDTPLLDPDPGLNSGFTYQILRYLGIPATRPRDVEGMFTREQREQAAVQRRRQEVSEGNPRTLSQLGSLLPG